MQDLVIDYLKNLNIGQLLATGVMFWFFYNRLDGKIERLSDRIEKLNDKVEDIARRLCRIEGSLSTHGHCIMAQAKPDNSAI